MDHLSAAQIEELRAAIEKERAALHETLGVHEREASAHDHQVETQDAAMQEQLRTEGALRGDRARTRLAQLDAALVRMSSGEYGVCEETDDEIPFARLRAQPTAQHTVEGLESLEREEQEHSELPKNPGAY